MPKTKQSKPSFAHASADPFEISYIMGGKNKEQFSEMNIRAKRDNPNQITFSTDDESNFEDLYPLLDEILSKYRSTTIRTAPVRPEQVAFFRGKESVHLQRIKEMSMIDNVFFNDRTAKGKDGSEVKMVEVTVLGTVPCINKFMTELLNSILNFQLREMEIEMPPRETKEERESKKKSRKKKEDDDEE